MSEPRTLDMYIDGRRVPARSGERFDVLNPATGEVYATVPKGDVDDVDEAVSAARRALEGDWRRSAGPDRAVMLGKLARLLENRIMSVSQAPQVR